MSAMATSPPSAPPAATPTSPTLKRPAPSDVSPPAKKPALDAERQRTRRLFGGLIAPSAGPRVQRTRPALGSTAPPSAPAAPLHPLSRQSPNGRRELQRRVDTRDRRVARENALWTANGLVTRAEPRLVWLPRTLTEEQRDRLDERKKEQMLAQRDDAREQSDIHGEEVERPKDEQGDMDGTIPLGKDTGTLEDKGQADEVMDEDMRDDRLADKEKVNARTDALPGGEEDTKPIRSRSRSLSYDEPANDDQGEDTVVY